MQQVKGCWPASSIVCWVKKQALLEVLVLVGCRAQPRSQVLKGPQRLRTLVIEECWKVGWWTGVSAFTDLQTPRCSEQISTLHWAVYFTVGLPYYHACFLVHLRWDLCIFRFSRTDCWVSWGRSQILGWPKSSFGFFHNILRNELFGQPSTWPGCRSSVSWKSWSRVYHWHFIYSL